MLFTPRCTCSITIVTNQVFYFRGCNHYQTMFQKLSAKVDKTFYQAAVNKTMSLLSFCNKISAWESSNVEEYKNCTNQIVRSNNKIQENYKFIEYYSMNHASGMSIQAELEQVLEDVDLKPNPLKGLVQVLDFIKNQSLIEGEPKNALIFFTSVNPM